jgi:hypothetical protein
MFKGFNENQKKILEEKNQSTNNFAFSLADLELTEINGDRRKCRIIDEELSNKLRQLYSEGKNGYVPPMKFIDFESKPDPHITNFPDDLHFQYNYVWWLSANKKSVQENSELLSDGTLKFKFLLDPMSGLSVFSIS